MIRPLLAASLLTGFAIAEGDAQTPADTNGRASQQDLSEFEGLYRYRDGGTLVMVADGERLVAIIGEAKYRLRSAATDTFTNPSGALIPFVRDTTGRILAFKERGDAFVRLSPVVTAEVRALLEPRSRGPDGRPVPYRCKAPATPSNNRSTTPTRS